MADGKPTNPPTFGEMITQWERNFDAFANQVMGTEEFSRFMNQFQNWQLEMQRTFSEAMTRHLTAANIPTRDDVIDVADRVAALDARLARIEAALGIPQGASDDVAPSPPRTRKPPSQRQNGSNDAVSS